MAANHEIDFLKSNQLENQYISRNKIFTVTQFITKTKTRVVSVFKNAKKIENPKKKKQARNVGHVDDKRMNMKTSSGGGEGTSEFRWMVGEA